MAEGIDGLGVALWSLLVLAGLFCCGFLEPLVLRLERLARRIYRAWRARRYRGVKVTAEELRRLAS